MWAGNIPSDATHDEIYQFFSQPPGDRGFEPASTGAVSVFLISRSNCAFINFESEGCLLEAISRFNGVHLRADDPRCARLVCRVRRKDDDLMAGVGSQRGTGMHARWVKDKKQKAQEKTKQNQSDLSVSDHRSTSPSSISEQLGYGISNLSLSSDNLEVEQNVHAKHSSTSDSYSSSNSSFFARHFPKRYFILKSLTQVSYSFLLRGSIYLFIWII
jgi:RNA recognition motif-containing protein